MVEFDERFCAVLSCGHRVGVTRHLPRIAFSACKACFRSSPPGRDPTLLQYKVPHGVRPPVGARTTDPGLRNGFVIGSQRRSSSRPAFTESTGLSAVRETPREPAEARRCFGARGQRPLTTAVRGQHLTRIDVGVTPAICATETARTFQNKQLPVLNAGASHGARARRRR